MKFTTVAVLSCAVASVAAVPVQGDLAARNSVTDKFHQVKTEWKNTHAEKNALEEKKDAAESQRNQNIKNIIFHSSKQQAQKRTVPHPIEAGKQMWTNHKEEHTMEKQQEAAEDKLEDENDKAKWQALRHGGVSGGFSIAAGWEQRKKGKIAEDQLERQNKNAHKDLERVNRKKTTDKFWGTTNPNAAPETAAAATVVARNFDLPVEDGAIEKRGMEFRSAWAAWRKASQEEDTLEDQQEKDLKDFKAKQKAVMKELKDKNWAIVKAAWTGPATDAAPEQQKQQQQ